MTSLIKIREIPGGIHPPEHKEQSLRLPLGSVPLPPQLVVPVSQHIGEPATPVVSVGERVLTGQLIAAANGVFSANIHAPSSGTVVAIEDRVLTHPSGMSDDTGIDGGQFPLPLFNAGFHRDHVNTIHGAGLHT